MSGNFVQRILRFFIGESNQERALEAFVQFPSLFSLLREFLEKFRDSPEKRASGVDFDHHLTILADVFFMHGAAEFLIDYLKTVADA